MKDKEVCKFCEGTKIIRYQYHGEQCLEIAVDECPCVEINRLKTVAKIIREDEGLLWAGFDNCRVKFKE